MNRLLHFICTLAISSTLCAQTNVFEINTSRIGTPIPKTLFGVFFEDINFAADGGLYAELVKNRSFEYPDHLAGWTISGNVTIHDDGPFNNNPHYVRLTPAGHREKHTMIENEGYFGIGVKENKQYKISVWARVASGKASTLKVQLVDNATMSSDQQIGVTTINISGNEWKKYSAIITPQSTFAKAHLRIWSDEVETMDLEHISLFPTDTYKGRENGCRNDLALLLEQMHPGVLRFPGGCIVEGTDLATRYQWKNTVGIVENRPLNENRWHYCFTYRYFPDYFQSEGLGFYEYFQLAEDIGAEPLPVLNVGMSCQYQNDIADESIVHVAVDQLQPYIDDCIDLIEFANGDPTKNVWAKLRADMGHVKPFGLKYLAIGNEQWDYDDNPAYTKRLRRFVEAVRKAHPEIKIVGSTGPGPDDDKFHRLQPLMKEIGCDLYDEHFYRNEQWFLNNASRYDHYDRSKHAPKVFAGEYACHGKGKKYNHFNAALMEAALMTGIERNADVVEMATYAPLFAHIEGWQWRPDAIWFDNLNSFGTCSYYVQRLYSTNKGTNVLSLTMNGKPVAGSDGQNGLYASSVLDADTGQIVIKIVNASDKPQDVTLKFKGLKNPVKGKNVNKWTRDASLTVFHSSDLNADNTIQHPNLIVPLTSSIKVEMPSFSTQIPAHTFQIYRINLQ